MNSCSNYFIGIVIVVIVGIGLSSHVLVSAFLPSTLVSIERSYSSPPLYVSWWNHDDDESRHAAMQHNIMRTDIRNFLTQRSLQSFMHLCMQCRDPHTVKWMETFGRSENLGAFHGTGGLNTTLFPIWSSILLELLEQPQDVIAINVTTGQGNHKNKNPYIEENLVSQFEIDIDPTSLVNRILSVREQIANEWVSDLDAMKTANEMLLKSYNEKIRNREKKDYDTNSNPIAFERHGISYFFDAFGERASSPLRKGSFDLLTLLATQESIHRVLRNYVDAGTSREVSFCWLREYYSERAANYFDGDQELGRADDFLEELLLTPPTIQTDNSEMSLVDPLRIAEDIIATRSEVAVEWREIVRQVKEVDHTDIRKMVLEKQMLKWGSGGTTTTTTTSKTNDQTPKVETTTTTAQPAATTSTTSNEAIGEFQ